MKKRDRVQAKYNNRCAYCGHELDDKWQVDHKVSRQYWPYYGSDVPVEHEDNLVPSCREENHYKREKCVESKGHHIGYREYLSTLHTRLKKLPKKTIVARTQRRIDYLWTIANKYGITPDRPFNGVFYMDIYNQQEQVPHG